MATSSSAPSACRDTPARRSDPTQWLNAVAEYVRSKNNLSGWIDCNSEHSLVPIQGLAKWETTEDGVLRVRADSAIYPEFYIDVYFSSEAAKAIEEGKPVPAFRLRSARLRGVYHEMVAEVKDGTFRVRVQKDERVWVSTAVPSSLPKAGELSAVDKELELLQLRAYLPYADPREEVEQRISQLMQEE